MKKICFITTVPGTLKSFVLPTAAGMHEDGEFDISFICNEDDEFAKSLPDYIHYFPVKMKRGINLYGIKATYEMYKIFKREKFDLVQYSTPNAALYASIASKLAHLPIRLYSQCGIIYVGFGGLKRKIFKLIEKVTCKFSTWVEPVSEGNLNFGREEGLFDENNSSIVWNGSSMGVDMERFDISKKTLWGEDIRRKYAVPDDAFVYGFVGRITTDKGVNELFESFEDISHSKENVYLLMIGRREKEIDEQLFKKAENNPKVIFTGNVNDPERYYAAMDVFVLPSYREGFGSAITEAEAMGVPVIVTDIPGPIDAMRADVTGLTVKKADVESLKSAMYTMYENDALREKCASLSRDFILNHFEQNELISRIIKERKRLLETAK